MTRKDRNLAWIGAALCVPAILMTAAVVMKKITFEQKCGGFLVRASNANTVELARTELGRAIHYLEDQNLTSGYTSIIYQTPDEDIGFWYRNLVESQKELTTLVTKPDLTSLEQSNTLIKLRETLLEHGSGGGETLTCPEGISRYPSNGAFAFGTVVTGFLAMVGLIMLGVAFNVK